MYLSDIPVLEWFTTLAECVKIDYLDLELFIERAAHHYNQSQKKKLLENINILIDSIHSPDNFLLTPLLIDNSFMPIQLYDKDVFGDLTAFHKQSLEKAGLVEGIDYTIVSYDVETLAYHSMFSGFFKENTLQKYESLFSLNGLKKLTYYMHVQMMFYDDYSGKLERALDFEKVYLRVKELHAKNRKAYLKAVSKANKKRKLMKFIHKLF